MIGGFIAQFAFVSADISKTQIAGMAFRKVGISVYTQFSGNRKKQWQRASANAAVVLDLDDKAVISGIMILKELFDG